MVYDRLGGGNGQGCSRLLFGRRGSQRAEGLAAPGSEAIEVNGAAGGTGVCEADSPAGLGCWGRRQSRRDGGFR